MTRWAISVFLVALLAFTGAGLADWDPGTPAKWVQLPDLSQMGIDVNASYGYILADDYQCTETEYITSVHIWGSWLGDGLPFQTRPDSMKFTLSFHEDIPDSESSTGYSMPGDVIWYREFLPGEFSVRPWSQGILEGWMDPPETYIFPADTVCWQYNFYLDFGEFLQQGTIENPVTYWLDVKAEPFDLETFFGWKTSRDHWNDDAVWGQGFEPYLGPWFELIYPPDHPFYGESIDLAFVIVGEEEPDTYKWEQLPDLRHTGIDVEATGPYLLADDFLCTEPGRISEIHVWGSWLNDYLPFGTNPRGVDFILSIHKDIPSGPGGYSQPGAVLWYQMFLPADFTVEAYAEHLREGWMVPPEEYWFPADSTCWLYKFFVDPDTAFFQSGTPDDPIVYWLDVQAIPRDMNARFGWKTSEDQWNDDAVWGQGAEPYLGPWFELIYPPQHPFAGESIDLAFRIFNDPMSGVPSQGAVPEGLRLFQNTPNPFSKATTLRYSLPSSGHVKLVVYDVEGRAVRTLIDEVQSGGMKAIEWSGTDDDGRQMPAGIYFYSLTSGGRKATRKMMYLK
jgi:hypothetical protein